ncbi:translocase [Oceaniglobus ichthyenteri]|uniref:translocase n=1 Tax=Oceaniglobus ichthyenteri TaxID=2136177 RepID=UPI000D385930|nr:translocase [Oceaniglobus ichthyenteri]
MVGNLKRTCAKVVSALVMALVVLVGASHFANAAPAPDCTPRLTSALMPGAMVRLSATAPCAPGALVKLRHGGVLFDMVADAAGRLDVDIPALSEIAVFEAEISGQTLRTTVAIPDFDTYQRITLQWQGQTGLQIHAREFGATHGSDGHIWVDAPGTAQRAIRARGGFITRLGDDTLQDGHSAEIYVFPTEMTLRTGTIRLSVQTMVDAYTCGTTVHGHAMQPGGDGKMAQTALTVEIPACDAIGDILVLNNLLRDMKIAAN